MSDSSALVPVPGSVEQAVQRAHVGYVTDAQKRSLEFWHRECASEQIGWSCFRRRASLGHWTDERDQFWRDVSARVFAERADALAQAQVRELADLEGARHPSVLNKPFTKIGEATKITKHVTAHTLRRTFNNLMRQSGVDRMTLRAMTGHSSEEMTQHYSEVTAEEKRQAVAKGLSPLLALVRGKTGDETGDQGVGQKEAHSA